MKEERSDPAQIKILEAGKKARRILNFLHRAYNDPEEMEDALASIAKDKSVIHLWQTVIDNIRAYGVRDLVKRNSKIAVAAGLDARTLEEITDINDKEPWLIAVIRDAYKAVFREQWVEQVNSWDPLSRIGSISELGDTDFASDWIFDGNPLTEWAYSKGNNAVVFGRVKRGKTDFSLRLTEYFLEENWIIVSNIRVRNAPKDYHYTPTLTEMLREICKARLEGKKVLILMDEGAIFWIKIDTIQSQNKALAKIILTLGKLDSNLLYIGHREKDVPDIVIWSAVAYFEKLAVKKVNIEIQEGLKLKSSVYTGVPKTSFEFNPGEIQNFEVDLVVEDLFKFMSKLEEGTDQWTAMLRYLDDHGGELKDEDKHKAKIVAQYLKEKNPDMTSSAIGDLVKVSQPTAYRYIKDAESSESAK